MIFVIPKKVNPEKCKKSPKNLWRRNMYRHVTTKKKGKKGPYRGRVQELYEKGRNS